MAFADARMLAFAAMREFLRIVISVCLDGVGIVTIIATVGTVAALLPYALLHRRIAYLAFGVSLAGAAAVLYQWRKLYRQARTRNRIGELLAEGHRLVLKIGGEYPGRYREFPGPTVRDYSEYKQMADWCSQVEAALRAGLGESYVTRFHLGGSNEQDARSMTVWKMNHRLETLASFLNETRM